MKTYTVTAHTGNEKTRDNSLESIRSAARNGADIVEFDLLYRRDGTPVMRHSHPVMPNTPTVEHGFEEIAKTKLKVNIDVKDTSHLKETIALAEKAGIKKRCFFTGICVNDVAEVRKQCPGTGYYLNYDVDEKKNNDDAYIAELVKLVADCGARGINCHYSGMNRKLCEALHAAGLEASVWTCNDIATYRKMAALGVDNITTRYPSFEKIK